MDSIYTNIMATTANHNLIKDTVEIKKTEDSGEVCKILSLPLSNNTIPHYNINDVTKRIDCQDGNNIVNDVDNNSTKQSLVEEKLLLKESKVEMMDDVIKNTNCEVNQTENSVISSQVLINQSKDTNCQTENESIVSEMVAGKRKRKLSSDVKKEKASTNDGDENIKRKKQNNTNDNYCWRCHKDIVDTNCSACPRSWHRKCMSGTPPTSKDENWICGECASILQAENATTRPLTIAHLSIEQLCMVLKYVIDRMRNFPGSEPFWSAVDLKEVPNYLDYVIKPMDLSLLEYNVNSKLYGSTDAFMADAKWIQHNCIVFNTCGGIYADTSKLTNAAKQIIKIARQEVSEIEACPDCYTRGRNLPRPHASWFIEACRQPHPLVWAKLKGFPFWPAKALPRINGQGHVDVRFFGEHDRAWISPKDIYLYSRDPPTSLPRKKKQDMYECIREITQHCQKLEMAFGTFQFAPSRIQYNPYDPMQIKVIFPEYNPELPYDATKPFDRDNKISPPSKKQSLPMKKSSTVANETSIGDNLDINPLENTDGPGNNSIEFQNTNNNHLKESSGFSKQKNRPITSSTAQGIESDQMKSSDSSSDSTVKKITAVTPKSISSRKTLSRKFTVSKTCDSINEKSIDTTPKKMTRKNRQNNIRKVNATSTPILTTSTNGKVPKPNMIRIYKSKTKFVDNIDAEKHEVNKEDTLVKIAGNPSDSIQDSVSTSEPGNSLANTSSSQYSDESIEESVSKLSNSSVDSGNKISIEQSTSVGKRQSKAKKSFPNKPPPVPTQIAKKSTIDSVDTKDRIQTNFCNELNYQLLPPDAGPLSAQLNRGANELAVKMARFIEEVVQDAAQSKIHDLSNIDAHQATVYSLRLQIERMKWQHQQQLSELKCNADQTMREMRASLEVERLRAIEEIRKEAEEKRLKCVEETKSKQWCSFCGNEALYYCCWNTAYCNHTCQQMHWQTHMGKCTQKPTTVNPTTSGNNDASETSHQSQDEQQQPQAMPTLTISAQQHASSNVRGA